MSKSVLTGENRKCLKCSTYHESSMKHCPICGRYLYAIGFIYQPKIKKEEVKSYV